MQDSVAVVIPKKRGKYEKYKDKERYVLENMAANMEPQQR